MNNVSETKFRAVVAAENLTNGTSLCSFLFGDMVKPNPVGPT
jgi:hypothetical protein